MADRINHGSAAWEGSPNLNETLLASKQSRLCFAPWVEVVVVVFVCFLVGSKCGSGSCGCGSGLRRTNRPSISVPSVRLRLRPPPAITSLTTTGTARRACVLLPLSLA